MNAKKLLSSLLIGILIMAPAASFAQDIDDQDLMITTYGIRLTSTYIFVIGGLTGAAIGSVVSATIGNSPLMNGLNKDELSMLASYIEEHDHQLAQDIALGGGETVNDLAQLYGVPANKRVQFAKALRRERRALMISQGSSRDEVERFGLIVLKIKCELDGLEVAIAQ